MNFSQTLPELADLNEQLPYPNTMAEAYWLAELACMCHQRLSESPSALLVASLWMEGDKDTNKRLEQFFVGADDRVFNLVSDLFKLARDSEAKQHRDELF